MRITVIIEVLKFFSFFCFFSFSRADQVVQFHERLHDVILKALFNVHRRVVIVGVDCIIKFCHNMHFLELLVTAIFHYVSHTCD